jgi:O-antigen/teichoic acid export membrane protein
LHNENTGRAMRSGFLDRLKRLARTPVLTAAVAFTGRTSQQVSSVALVLIAATFLSPAEYGVYSLATAFALVEIAASLC